MMGNFMNIFSNTSRKEKLGLAVAVLIVIFAFLDRLVVAPIGMKFKKINSEIKMSEIQLAQSLHNLNNKDDIAKEYQKYMQYIKSN